MQKAAGFQRARRAPVVERGLQEGEGSQHIGLQERLGILNGAIDMRLGGQMRDAAETMFVEQAADQRGVVDVALDESDAPLGNKRLDAAQIGRIGDGVDDYQPIGGSRGAPGMQQVLADETGAAGNQDSMHQNLRPAALVAAAEIVNTMQRGLNSERNAWLTCICRG